MLGGRTAEQLQFKEVSSGAADDLKNATHLARQMITRWGMNTQLGPVSLQQSEEHPFLGREVAEPKQYSEYSARMIDKEISALISRCAEESLQRLTDHQNQLAILAAALIERESLSGSDIQQLLMPQQPNRQADNL